MGEHSVCVGAQKEIAVGGISQSSNSVLLRGDRLCVIERETEKEKKKTEAERQFRFHCSHYSSDTGQFRGLSLPWDTYSPNNIQ